MNLQPALARAAILSLEDFQFSYSDFSDPNRTHLAYLCSHDILDNWTIEHALEIAANKRIPKMLAQLGTRQKTDRTTIDHLTDSIGLALLAYGIKEDIIPKAIASKLNFDEDGLQGVLRNYDSNFFPHIRERLLSSPYPRLTSGNIESCYDGGPCTAHSGCSTEPTGSLTGRILA